MINKEMALDTINSLLFEATNCIYPHWTKEQIYDLTNLKAYILGKIREDKINEILND